MKEKVIEILTAYFLQQKGYISLKYLSKFTSLFYLIEKPRPKLAFHFLYVTGNFNPNKSSLQYFRDNFLFLILEINQKLRKKNPFP